MRITKKSTQDKNRREHKSKMSGAIRNMDTMHSLFLLLLLKLCNATNSQQKKDRGIEKR